MNTDSAPETSAQCYSIATYHEATPKEAAADLQEVELQPGQRMGWWEHNSTDEDRHMTAMVRGAVCDEPTLIMLDTGATTSIVSLDFARKSGIKLKFDSQLTVSGMGGTKTKITARARVKITLGLCVVYVMDVWVGNIGEGVNCLLGMNFMYAAGVRLSAREGALELPDEERILLVGGPRQFSAGSEQSVTAGEFGHLSPGETAVIPLSSDIRKRLDEGAQLWVGRGEHWVTQVKWRSQHKPAAVQVVNISQEKVLYLPRHVSIAVVVDREHLPRTKGKFVRPGTVKYREWAQLAYENRPSLQFVGRDDDEAVGPAVAKSPAASVAPEKLLLRSNEVRRLSCPAGVATHNSLLGKLAFVATAAVEGRNSPRGTQSSGPISIKSVTSCDDDAEANSIELLGMNFARVMRAEAELSREAPPVFLREGEDAILLHELRDQLATLPDLPELTPTADIETADVGDPGETSPEQEDQVREILRRHKSAFLGEGNALPPPARGVVCDLEVHGAKPIAQRSRRIPPQFLHKVYELLKKLLESGLIEFSDSQWASPIVIVLKKNGKDIRLCIDYRLVNQLLELDLYPMPLIDDLLDNFEAVQWLVSLDMASGFWAVPLTERARKISAFVCPLGHFQWTRMPFGLKNAPLIYQRILDNCLWGFVRLPPALEAQVDPDVLEYYHLNVASQGSVHTNDSSPEETYGELHGEPEPLTVFQINHPAPPQMGPVLGRSSYVDDVAYGAKTWEEMCEKLNELLFRLRYWGISVSLPKSVFGKREIDFLSHKVSREGIQATPKIAKTVRDMPFPTSLKGVQSFLGSLNYYAKFIEGLPFIASVLYELSEEQVRSQEGLEKAKQAFEMLKEKITSTPLLRHPDRSKPFVIITHANEWAVSAVIAQEDDGVLFPVRFTGRVLHGAELNYPAAEKEILALFRALEVYLTLLLGQKLKVYTRYSTLGWLFRSKSLKGRCHQWATMLSPWTLEVTQMSKDLDGLAAIFSASITPREHLDEVVENLAPQKVLKKPTPPVSLEMLESDYEGWLLTFDGAAKLKSKVGSAGSILWHLPEWRIIEAHGEYLTEDPVTVNVAEYRGLLYGLKMALRRGVDKLVVVGDSRLAIQQAQGVINCHDAKLQVLLTEVRSSLDKFTLIHLIHVKRAFNAAADHVTTRTLQCGHSLDVRDSMELELLEKLNRLPERLTQPPEPEEILDKLPRGNHNSDLSPDEVARSQNQAEETDKSDGRPSGDVFAVQTRARERQSRELPEGVTEDPEVAVETRWERIRVNQDAEEPLRKLKCFLQGDLNSLTHSETQNLAKTADRFVLDDKGVLFYLPATSPKRPRPEADHPRLVVPQELQEDLLQQYHEDKQGGHQGILRTFERLKKDFYWVGMYASVERYVKECVDCTTAKGTPSNPGPSPGNLLAEEPFQVVSMDFVLPLPKTAKGNTALLLFQDSFSGYVMCKPMSRTTSQDVAEAYEECVFQHFGASSKLRHDRDPRFMSEVFRRFRELLGSQQRSTLAYRPQANGQQERSGQTVIRSIRAYVQEADQSDWDDIVRRLMFCINTSFDSTRRETPFYLVHGWDARTTVKAMLGKVPRGVDAREAYLWRAKVQREYEYAKAWARDLQKEAKKRRSDQQTELWKALSDKFKDGFGVGDAVWLYMPRVQPGLSKKLTHKWHGPFRILERDSDFRYRLRIEGTDYKFYPWVHVSRLKPRLLHEHRPIEVLQDVPDLFDFDAALLPEDSWVDEEGGDYEVEEILDVRTVKKTRNARQMREYLVKWRGYDETEWVPLERLNCGRLLYEFDKKARSRARFRSMQSADEFSDVNRGDGAAPAEEQHY